MAQDVNGVEIFSTGTWSGNRTVTVTENDLHEMVNSFNDLTTQVPGFRPFLKLGHTEMQKFFGGESGAPSLGFVSKIWVEGQKVLANFSNVPDALVDLMGQGRYNSVSVEFLPRVQFDGSSFKNVLRAVALLGAEWPAVKGLKELSASLMSEFAYDFEDADPAETFEKELEMPNEATFTQAQVDALIETAVNKAVDTAKAALSDEVDALKAEITDLKADNAKLAEGKAAVEASMKEFVTASETKDIERLVDKGIDEGKILPAQRDHYVALAQLNQTVKFGEDEKSAREIIEELLEGEQKKVDLTEGLDSSQSKKDTDVDGSPAEIVHARTESMIKASEGKLDYATAYKEVLAQDPELSAQYAAMEE